jgi:hypothetical protein
MKSVSTQVIYVLGLAAATVFGIGGANAADWHWDPRVDVSGNYDDNYGLETGNAQNISVAGSILDASLRASILDPNTRFEITPRVHSVYYPGQTEFDANNLYLDSQFQQMWQRANFTLYEMYWSQDVLRSYLPTTEIGAPLGQTSAGADLAAVNQRIRQNLLVLTPSATFDLSPRERLDIQAQFMNVDYSQAIADQVENFKNFSGSIGLGFATSPQSTVTVRATAADLKPAAGTGATTYGGEGDWNTHLSERMQAYAKLGLERTSFNQTQYGKSSATSVSGGLGISRKFVAYDVFADYSRSVSPDSAGTVVVRDDLRVRLEHKFSARTAGYAGLRGINQTALGNSAGFVGQRYAQAALGIEWRIYRQFSIISEYAYTTLRETNVALPPGSNAAPGSNAVTITLRYEPHRPAEEFGISIGR